MISYYHPKYASSIDEIEEVNEETCYIYDSFMLLEYEGSDIEKLDGAFGKSPSKYVIKYFEKGNIVCTSSFDFIAPFKIGEIYAIEELKSFELLTNA